jgi:hypothetical protein
MRAILSVIIVLMYFSSQAQNETFHAIRVEPISPASANWTVGYEYGFGDYAFQFEVGILDPFKRAEYQEGYFFKISGKFPDFTGALSRDSYLIAQVIPAFYIEGDYSIRAVAYMIGAGDRFGKKRLFVDYYSAIGFSTTNRPSRAYHYGFLRLNDDFPLTLTVGLSLGYKF